MLEEENKIKKQEIQRKIKFLKGYYWTSKDLEKLEEKLKEITLKIHSIKASSIDAMPKGNALSDISDLLVQQEQHQEEVIKKILEQENKRVNIERCIDSLENSKLKVLLKKIYLDNMPYKEIEGDLRISDRHIRRLHEEAINQLLEIDRKELV